MDARYGDRKRQVIVALRDWLPALASELTTPDLWAESEGVFGILGSELRQNEPIAEATREAFGQDLDEIKEDFESRYRENREAIIAIRREIDQLREASKRLGLSDLKRFAASAVVTLGVEHGSQLASDWLVKVLPLLQRIPELPASIVT